MEERLAWDQEAAGPIPATLTLGPVAHLGERLVCIQEAASSILARSNGAVVQREDITFATWE